MKTIIKIPLYIEIETEDGKDRKAISGSVRSYFIPEFYHVVQDKFDLVQWMDTRVLRDLQNITGPGTRFRLLTETDLFVPKGKGSSDINLNKIL